MLHHSSNFAHLKFHKLRGRIEEFLWFSFRLYFYVVALVTFYNFGVSNYKTYHVVCLYYDDNDLSISLRLCHGYEWKGA